MIVARNDEPPFVPLRDRLRVLSDSGRSSIPLTSWGAKNYLLSLKSRSFAGTVKSLTIACTCGDVKAIRMS